MRTVCIIQARLNSTRLPEKILASIEGRSMLSHVVGRAWKIPGVDQVIVTVPFGQREAIQRRSIGLPIVAIVEGPHPDVLTAYVEAAKSYAYHAEVIMRITGDCPLIDPVLCGEVLQMFHVEHSVNDIDYAANVGPDSRYPDGLDCEVVSRVALDEAYRKAIHPDDRHHVMPWIRRNLRCFYLQPYDLSSRLSSPAHKWSVDTAEDLARVRVIMRLVNGKTGWLDTLAASEAFGGRH